MLASNGDVQQRQPAETDGVDDEIMTSSSRDGDDNGEDDDSDDEAGVVTSPSAADMKQQVDLGPEVSTSGFTYFWFFTRPVYCFGRLNRQSIEILLSICLPPVIRPN